MWDCNGTALTLLEDGGVREERSGVAVRPEPLECEPERHAFELAVVLRRRRLAAELAANSMHLRGLLLEAVEQRSLDEQVVGALVIGRHERSSPHQRRARAPVGLELSGELVGGAGCIAAGERDVLAGSSGLDEEDGRGALRFAGSRRP